MEGAASGCCFMGVVVTTGSAASELGEGRGGGEAAVQTIATETTCLGTDESVAASSSPISTVTVGTILSFTSRQVAAAEMVSMVTSRVRGAASLGVVAWLVSVS